MAADTYHVVSGPGVPKGMVVVVNPGSVVAWMGTVKEYVAFGDSIQWVDGSHVNLNPMDHARLKERAAATGKERQHETEVPPRQRGRPQDTC